MLKILEDEWENDNKRRLHKGHHLTRAPDDIKTYETTSRGKYAIIPIRKDLCIVKISCNELLVLLTVAWDLRCFLKPRDPKNSSHILQTSEFSVGNDCWNGKVNHKTFLCPRCQTESFIHHQIKLIFITMRLAWSSHSKVHICSIIKFGFYNN